MGSDGDSNEKAVNVDATEARRKKIESIKTPEPTYAFGAIGRVEFNPNPAGPTAEELESRSLVESAMKIKNPWSGDESLY